MHSSVAKGLKIALVLRWAVIKRYHSYITSALVVGGGGQKIANLSHFSVCTYFTLTYGGRGLKKSENVLT